MTEETNQSCGICFSQIDEDHTPRGIMGDSKGIICPHIFCEDCILEWSRGTNICPHCRRRFSSITVLKNRTISSVTTTTTGTTSTPNNNNNNNKPNPSRGAAGKNTTKTPAPPLQLTPGTKIPQNEILKVHKVKRKNLRLDSDEDDELEEGWEQALMPEQGLVCAVCLEKATDMMNVVLCDRRACEYRAHLKCAGLDRVPSFSAGEQWFCPEHRRPNGDTTNVPPPSVPQQPPVASTNKPQAARSSPSRAGSVVSASSNGNNNKNELSLEDFILDEEFSKIQPTMSSRAPSQAVNNNNDMMMMMNRTQNTNNAGYDDEDEDDVPLLQRFSSSSQQSQKQKQKQQQPSKSPSLANLSQSSMLMMNNNNGNQDYFNNSQQQLSQESSMFYTGNNNNMMMMAGRSPAPRTPHQRRLDELIQQHTNNNSINSNNNQQPRPQVIPSTFTRSQVGAFGNAQQQQQVPPHIALQQQMNRNYLMSQQQQYQSNAQQQQLNKLQQLQLEKYQKEEEEQQQQQQQQQQGRRGGNKNQNQNIANNNNNNSDNDDNDDGEGDPEEFLLMMDNDNDDNNNNNRFNNRQQNNNNSKPNQYLAGAGGTGDAQWRRAGWTQHPLENATYLPSAATYGAQPNLIQQQQVSALDELRRRKEGTDRLNLYRRVQVENAVSQAAASRMQQQQMELLARRQQQQQLQAAAGKRLLGTASRNPSKSQGVRQNVGPTASSEYGNGAVYQKYSASIASSNNNNNAASAQRNQNNINTNSNANLIMNAVSTNRLTVSEALEQAGGRMSMNAQAQILSNLNNVGTISRSGRIQPPPGDRTRQRDGTMMNNPNQNQNQEPTIDLAQHLRQKYYRTYFKHHLSNLNTSTEARSMTEKEEERAYREAKQRAEVDVRNLISRFERERDIEVEKAKMRKAAQQEAALRELMAFVQSRRLLNFDHDHDHQSQAPSQSQQQQHPRPKPVMKMAHHSVEVKKSDSMSMKREF